MAWLRLAYLKMSSRFNGLSFGDLLAINFNDLPYIAAGVIIVLGTLLYFWQTLLSTTVSPELAQVEGINIKKCDLF